MENDFFLYDDDDYDSMDMDMYSEDMWEDEDVYQAQQITIAELVDSCVHPTLRDTSSMVGKLLIYCVAFRFTTSLVELPHAVIHLTSVTTGLLALQMFAQQRMLYVLALCLIGYVSMLVARLSFKKYHGAFCAVVVVLYLIVCELFIVESKDWHVIRGIQMILTLKIVSLGFDLDKGTVTEFPSLFEAAGYYLCVGTLIFGPWTSFEDYKKLSRENSLCRRWILKLTFSLMMAVVCLLMSTCVCHWLIPDHANKWLRAYRDAASFRSSHYFVSFLSEATAVCVGFGASSEWNVRVSQPSNIEFPRSLTEVVIYWNMPMHYWLKTYVFKTFQPLHPFAAIFFTYAASSLLHGLNFQLAAVLLSLGFYTFIEYNFRKKLASVFSACISARRCNSCLHVYKSDRLGVRIVNIAFGFLAVFHLAYLGVMFDSSNAQQQDQGYSMEHTLGKWSELDFASHWVTAATYVLHWLI